MEFLHDPELWIAVAFVIFVVAAGRPIFRAITKMLDERAAKIGADLDEARRLREEAQALLAQYKKKQEEAAREASDIMTRAREEAEVFRKEASANLTAA